MSRYVCVNGKWVEAANANSDATKNELVEERMNNRTAFDASLISVEGTSYGEADDGDTDYHTVHKIYYGLVLLRTVSSCYTYGMWGAGGSQHTVELQDGGATLKVHHSTIGTDYDRSRFPPWTELIDLEALAKEKGLAD